MNISKTVFALGLSLLTATSLRATDAKANTPLNQWQVCPLQSEYVVSDSFGWFTITDLYLSPEDGITLADMVDSSATTQSICDWVLANVHGADVKSCDTYWNPVIDQLNTEYFGVPGAPRDEDGAILRIFPFYQSTPQINYLGTIANGCF